MNSHKEGMEKFMNLHEYCQSRRGFNYNPGYCSTCYEAWSMFDEESWRREICRGKTYFPVLNFLRIWLDWNAYLRQPEKFMENFDTVLTICHEQDIDVHPTLFNRWHDYTYDFGGIYCDHFIDRQYDRFESYIHHLAERFKDDRRIGIWDLCNEPQHRDKKNPLHQLEVDWLSWVAGRMRTLGVSQPITIGTTVGMNVEWVSNLCDVICIHPYGGWWNDQFAQNCDWAVDLAKHAGKPLIANETCQGSLDDRTRVEIIQKSLGHLKSRNIGWCAWQLHGGKMISGNTVIMDSNCKPGDRAYMAFIHPDGMLRTGHDIFNEF